LFDITGMRFGKLVAVEKVSTSGRALWRFACDCGGERVGMAQTAKAGQLKYCPECREIERGKSISTHGATSRFKPRVKLYDIWNAMRSRCLTPTAQRYASYGGRGIGICAEWGQYPAFEQWALANGYRAGLSIDRIDNDGPYSPANCRWATHAEQAQNKQQTRWVEYQGEIMNLMQLAKLTGISWFTLRGRLDAGLTADEAVNHPLRGHLPGRRNYRGVRA
jgi:hypothetical protein